MNHQIIKGIGELPQILNTWGCKRLFVVTGRHSFASLPFRELLEGMDVAFTLFSDFTPNPRYEEVCKGIDLIASQAFDAIIAIGGGSAMDVAKCIKLAVLAEEGRAALIPPTVLTRVSCDGSRLPLIAIPTTAGTGSESTHNAVMYYEGAKQTVTNDGVLPDVALLEPDVLKGLPLYQKQCTLMDALCQAIESWWSVHSTEESYEYSRQAVELIMNNWQAYIMDDDKEAAWQVMLGANFSGRAINITQTTAAHAMSYKLTSLYALPHGHAVALCLPEIWTYMLNNMELCIDGRGSDYLSDIFQQIAHAMGCDAPADAIALFRRMMDQMRLDRPSPACPSSDLPTLTSSVNPIRLKNNPVALSQEAIAAIYQTIINDRRVQ